MIANMSVAHWCVLVAAWLPIITAGLAKGSTIGQGRRNGGYDNNDPRAWFAQQSGWRQRADNAQKNGFEGLPFFIGAIALAEIARAPADRVDMLALIYIAARVVYTAVYLADLATVRTLVWFAGLVANMAILFAAVPA